MRISDWSSDVCSSDLLPFGEAAVLKRVFRIARLGEVARRKLARIGDDEAARPQRADIGLERGRVHRDPHVRLVARRLDVAGPDIVLNGGNAEVRARRRPDFLRKTGEGRSVEPRGGEE